MGIQFHSIVMWHLTSLKRMPIVFTFEWLIERRTTINIKSVILIVFIMDGGLSNE
jgi:hypothetical protein